MVVGGYKHCQIKGDQRYCENSAYSCREYERRHKSISRLRSDAAPPLHQQSRKYPGCFFGSKKAFEVASNMNKPPELPAKATHFTVQCMQKLIEVLKNGPDFGRCGRVVSVPGSGGGRKDSAGQQPDASVMPELPRYGFGYIITSI